MAGGYTVDANDTFANETCMDATNVAKRLRPNASNTEILEAQLDYMHARSDGNIFNFLKCASPSSASSQ